MSARIRFRPRIPKNAQCAHSIIVADFQKKKLISVDKKNIPKKAKFISGNKKLFSSFFDALINFI